MTWQQSGKRLLVTAIAVPTLAVLALAGYGFAESRRDPVIRRAIVRMHDWPAGAAPVTVALLSDIHIGGLATTPERLSRVVRMVNALTPDLVLVAGDFIAGEDPEPAAGYAERLVAPLARLHAPLGVVAVLGNHDHWTAPVAVRDALRRAGETVLSNDAVVRGPVIVIGVDDAFSGHADVAKALSAAVPLIGARIVLSHTPAIVAAMPRNGASLILAGHTHCGQVVLPVIGPLVLTSPRSGQALYDPHYRCGIVRADDCIVVVTAGIGGSLPFRIGAPPDLWLLTLTP